MLKQRVITGVLVAGAFVALLLLLPAPYLSAMSSTVIVFAAWEWSALAGEHRASRRGLFTAIVALLSLGIWLLLGWRASAVDDFLLPVFAAGAGMWLVLLVAVARYAPGRQRPQSLPVRMLLGLAILSLAGAGFTFLSATALGKFWIFYVIALVVVADVGAYFAGKTFGRKKLAPLVSPGKSWEGFWGGFVAAQVLAAICYLWVIDIFKRMGAPPALELQSATSQTGELGGEYFAIDGTSLTVFLCVAGLVSIASVLGDLYESVLKRNAGVKDSGTLLPGHGGVLDRIDGMLASVPLLALFVLILNW